MIFTKTLNPPTFYSFPFGPPFNRLFGEYPILTAN